MAIDRPALKGFRRASKPQWLKPELRVRPSISNRWHREPGWRFPPKMRANLAFGPLPPPALSAIIARLQMPNDNDKLTVALPIQ
jgi:hypothetical protein